MRVDIRRGGALGRIARCHRRARSPLVLASAAVLVAVLAAALTLILTPGTAHGVPFTVTVTSDNGDDDPGDGTCRILMLPGFCSLRAAIEEANAFPGDDTITVPAGTFPLVFGQLVISSTDKLTIVGAGAGNTIIDGGGGDRVFLALGAATLDISHVTVTGGLAVSSGGGGILNGGSLTLTNSTISGNSTTALGGGIWNGGDLTLTNTKVRLNEAQRGGGIYNAIGGTLTLNDSPVFTTVFSNTANQGGASGTAAR